MFLVAGVVILLAGAYGFYNNRRLSQTGRRASAEVVDVQVVYREGLRGPDGDSRTKAYYPVVRFRAADGREIVARTRSGRYPAPAKTGDHVRVIYQPGDPQVVSLDTPGGRGVALSGFAVIVGLAAVIYQLVS